ncbi:MULTISPECIES: type II toxin-antitoxin system RelE/ParE family toxin [unclassified Undibacterium]|uniref:type II toxin-antitoxin system RelE/ParE family toxin n=1 Tax=unclassified Undibacterium TaxID=2630295 RepID=UPI002AC9C152|nr:MULTISPECIES: type II toxin-antitoxin system RelE/ParE family toxin [unclassified Undibacterium]MEB0141141.1 type II toxin-antitoxin system RelE/ParE family toxin [Undibacterium sp. CCC2.1]MEB0174174.1 type II toxin-antitoxin system RelE/ParE family toxin [Undibacterium sp. CCC1.1]MEB0178116.1 type II toxin-antitoxin system RelE/ParE family toxin [Undibacterium sp. CCC3.4]MEB0217318.1 type II toxin-antitoxin system RelE/ParE family toxin [Undibacterium sp. 5I2]WPX45332.1 type II toxin-antit
MTQSKKWKVSFHDEFDPEFDAFSQDVQDELLAAAAAVRELGPAADRPHVGTLDNPRHPNMKELRFKANNGAEIWRAAFAFDPDREAIILVAADKQGIDEDKFYKDLLKKANKRFDQHLTDIKAAKTVKPTKAKSAKGKK